MRISLRSRILIYFVVIILFFAIVGYLAGVIFINRTTIAEEQRRVGVDLRSAWGVLNGKLSELSILVNVLSTGRRVAGAYSATDIAASQADLESARRQFGLDFLTLTDAKGQVILRTADPYRTGDILANDPFVSNALKAKPLAGFCVLSQSRLAREGEDLPEKAFMVFQPTPMARERAKSQETSGLVMIAATPIQDKTGSVLGSIYAGIMLNRNYNLVDNIRTLVFEGQVFDGKPVGNVTIFQWDVRVATNVILPNGNRALGTRVSSAVYERVLENQKSWYDRAFVVNDWYISAYDPILDVEDKVIGILYVGVLAKKYDDIRRNLWTIYGGLSIFTVALVALIGVLFSRRITRSVHRLSSASRRIAEGDLEHRVPEPRQNDEFRDLTLAFNSMAVSLLDRDERLEAAREELEQTNLSLVQLNHNYLEMLGFVSHELKNTLGVIYTSARTLSHGLVGELSPRQIQLVQGIDRNITSAVSMTRNYLDLTRIEKGELEIQPRTMDLVLDVVRPVLEDLKGAIADRQVSLVTEIPENLPLSGDPVLLRVVIKNLLDNALKYGHLDGEIRVGLKPADAMARLDVWNSGPGLSSDKLERVFDKFVRFEAGREADRKGTGLGLFITRDIVQKHGGRIMAESEPGSWIDFIVLLPLPDSQAVIASEAKPSG